MHKLCTSIHDTTTLKRDQNKYILRMFFSYRRSALDKEAAPPSKNVFADLRNTRLNNNVICCKYLPSFEGYSAGMLSPLQLNEKIQLKRAVLKVLAPLLYNCTIPNLNSFLGRNTYVPPNINK